MADQNRIAGEPIYIPAPYPDNEASRQTVVTRLLAHGFDLSELDALVGQVAEMFDVPMAAATVLDHDWQRFAAQHGLSGEKTSRAVAFCGYTISHAKPFVVLDAREDVRFAGNPFVVEDPSIRFYAGARIMVEGMPVGALCAIGQTPQDHVEQAMLDRLAELAGTASTILNAQLDGR